MSTESKNSTENHVLRNQRQFVFPEIDAAWRKNQVQQIEETRNVAGFWN